MSSLGKSRLGPYVSVACCLVFFLGFTACFNSAPKGSDVIIATVNHERISLTDFDNYFKKNWPIMSEENSVPPSLDIKLKFLNQLIEEKLILEEASRIGLEVNQSELMQQINEIKKDYTTDGFAKLLIDNLVDYEEWEQSLKNQMLMEKTIGVAVNERVDISREEIESYYKDNAKLFERQDALHIRQIVVTDRERAEETRKKALNGEDFTELARKYSTAPEALSGGDLGWISKGQLPSEMEKGAFGLKKGGISNVIETDFGFHILRLEETRPAGTIPLEEVENKIEKMLRIEKAERVYRQWMNMLWDRATIVINYQLL